MASHSFEKDLQCLYCLFSEKHRGKWWMRGWCRTLLRAPKFRLRREQAPVPPHLLGKIRCYTDIYETPSHRKGQSRIKLSLALLKMKSMFGHIFMLIHQGAGALKKIKYNRTML